MRRIPVTQPAKPEPAQPIFLTDKLAVQCKIGTNKDITDAFAEAHRSLDDGRKRFRVGPNQYTYQELVQEMKNHSHYGNEFITALRRKYG
ncbi:MAG: hypothetical protein AABY01_02605 [Nanoarchaeota archaeon]